MYADSANVAFEGIKKIHLCNSIPYGSKIYLSDNLCWFNHMCFGVYYNFSGAKNVLIARDNSKAITFRQCRRPHSEDLLHGVYKTLFSDKKNLPHLLTNCHGNEQREKLLLLI